MTNGSLRAVALMIALSSNLSACAAGRSVINVAPPPFPENSSSSFAKIVEVHDLRKFEVNPNDPSQPSIGNAADISNPSVTARAVGRKRGGYGNALGDLALPEGVTIASLVKDMAKAALQMRGYQVVDENSPDYARAYPLSLDIDQFWAWMKPGFFELTLSLESQIRMTGNELVGPSPQTVTGHYQQGAQAAFESTWAEVIQAGVNDLVLQLSAKLKSPPSAGS